MNRVVLAWYVPVSITQRMCRCLISREKMLRLPSWALKARRHQLRF